MNFLEKITLYGSQLQSVMRLLSVLLQADLCLVLLPDDVSPAGQVAGRLAHRGHAAVRRQDVGQRGDDVAEHAGDAVRQHRLHHPLRLPARVVEHRHLAATHCHIDLFFRITWEISAWKKILSGLRIEEKLSVLQ